MPTNRPFIAIVDDEESVRRAMKRLCRAYELDVAAFASAQQLFDSLESDHSIPDCLVIDIHMPGIGGLETRTQLVQRGIDIPSIMITGRDDEETRARALAAGACAYLCKPIDVSTLLGAIAAATGSRGTFTTVDSDPPILQAPAPSRSPSRSRPPS